jgi:hypothetical protein
MSFLGSIPLERAQAKRTQIERDLQKHPDFQLYLITKSHADRARMKRLLMEIPGFRLWRDLTSSIERARRQIAASVTSGRNIRQALSAGTEGELSSAPSGQREGIGL